MNHRERLWEAHWGRPVDRPPIWLREGFPLIWREEEAKDFSSGWQNEQVYRELYDHVAPHAGAIETWGVKCVNRLLMIPPKFIRKEKIEDTPKLRRFRETIHTPKGDLVRVTEAYRGQATTWCTQEPVQSREDLEKLASVPFDLDLAFIQKAAEDYRLVRQKTGDRGILRFGFPSPIVAISGAMPFELFLELSLTEKKWFQELCQEITRRILVVLEALLKEGPFEYSIANLGGAEQCTPPMMAPKAFDDYVAPYDGQIIERLHRADIPVNMHCHGKVRHALKCMVDMGVDSTDPVEPPPSGDLTYAEARELLAGRVTIVGNLEFNLLEHGRPEDIRREVREILSHGTDRLVLSASAGPISAITQQLADNYRAWIDAAMDFGQ